MAYLILFILGLCVGSFLNVIIYRETREEKSQVTSHKSQVFNWLPSWVTGRSYCDHCKKKIPLTDNIPLLSFLLLKGRCRYCHHKISFQYPLVELLTGLEFIWIYFLIKSNLNFFNRFEGFYSLLTLLIWFTLGAFLLSILIADFKYQIIPDTAVFGAILITFIKIIIDYRYTGMMDFTVLLSSFGASLFFLGLVLITHGKGMGLGDVKLAFLMGLLLGFPKIITALIISFLTGAIIGVILIILGKKKLKSEICFGPFLIAGLIFALFYGDKIWVYFN